jgi:hypothetical protein
VASWSTSMPSSNNSNKMRLGLISNASEVLSD